MKINLNLNLHLLLIIYFTCVCCIISQECPKEEAIKQFQEKVLLNPWPEFTKNPYKLQTESSMSHIREVLSNKTNVCAIKYEDEDKVNYWVMDFDSREEAEENGFIVTHQGPCGACSNLQDLTVYLREGLLVPVRKCGFKGAFSTKWALSCLKDLGFSDSCSQIWLYNTINTRQQCFWICMWSWIIGESNTKPDGNLNKCLQCDEDRSGPVFQFYSGRTRRNSGIHSEIERPGEQIYPMTHCYY